MALGLTQPLTEMITRNLPRYIGIYIKAKKKKKNVNAISVTGLGGL
jgi:hypothetical protein